MIGTLKVTGRLFSSRFLRLDQWQKRALSTTCVSSGRLGLSSSERARARTSALTSLTASNEFTQAQQVLLGRA